MSAHEALCMCFKKTWINFATCVSGVYEVTPVADTSSSASAPVPAAAAAAASAGSSQPCTGSYMQIKACQAKKLATKAEHGLQNANRVTGEVSTAVGNVNNIANGVDNIAHGNFGAAVLPPSPIGGDTQNPAAGGYAQQGQGYAAQYGGQGQGYAAQYGGQGQGYASQGQQATGGFLGKAANAANQASNAVNQADQTWSTAKKLGGEAKNVWNQVKGKTTGGASPWTQPTTSAVPPPTQGQMGGWASQSGPRPPGYGGAGQPPAPAQGWGGQPMPSAAQRWANQAQGMSNQFGNMAGEAGQVAGEAGQIAGQAKQMWNQVKSGQQQGCIKWTDPNTGQPMQDCSAASQGTGGSFGGAPVRPAMDPLSGAPAGG